MAHLSSSRGFLSLARSFKRVNVADPLMFYLTPRLHRTFATETSLPRVETVEDTQVNLTSSEAVEPLESNALFANHQFESASHSPINSFLQPRVLTTLYSWPELEPTRFAWYGSKQLNMPLRRDILHRAVVYEGDATRRGTASTKWRDDVHGSGRKILPQKGTGKARAGDKKSPIRRGGGVAFGPQPRDFSTDLPRKVYDIAWRTALSYRCRKGELIILDNKIKIPSNATGRLLYNVFEGNQWGRNCGRSLLVTQDITQPLFDEMKGIGEHGLVKDIEDVDVKDLLETGRIVIEKAALNTLLAAHSSDLGLRLTLTAARKFSEDSFSIYK